MKNVFICLSLVWLLASCNRKDKTENQDLVNTHIAKVDNYKKDFENKSIGNGTALSDSIGNATTSTGIALQGGQPIPPPVDLNKKIIKTADLNIEVKDFAKFNDMVHKSLRQYGAYIAQENQTANDYSISNRISIKVPVDQFDDMVLAMNSADAKLLEKKISSEDVSAEVVDIKSRMEAKKQMRARYLEFIKQAKNMEEVLSVQSSINDIQADIESADGRVQYLSQSAAYSTINISFSTILDANKKEDAEPNFVSRLGSSLAAGGKGLGEIVIALFALWPLFLLAGLAFLGYKKMRKTNSVAVTAPGNKVDKA